MHNESKLLDGLLKESILNPIGKPRLIDLLRKNKPTDLVILVSDITRSIANYHKILRFLASEIIDAGVDEKNIEFVVALGTHRKHAPEEHRSLYGDLILDFHFSFHDCHNNLTSLGKTSTNLEIQVNKRVKNADFVIATGKIDFHYIAGFSGGRKAILPGISSYETTRNNHCKLRRDGVTFAKMQHNIISQEMEEASSLFGCNYLLNVVETPENETARIFCGDSVYAFEQGVHYFTSQRSLKIPREVDCAIISAGGYPKDRNFYLSHKSLNNVIHMVKKGGAIILVAQCSEGIGNEKFLHYMLDNSCDNLLTYPEEDIEIGGHRAFITAKILRDYNVYVLSDLEPTILSQMNFFPIKKLDDALNHMRKDYGEEFKTYVIPDAQSILPLIGRRQA